MTTMTQPLFYRPEEFTEKTAGEVALPDDPNQWAQQILQELYKQVPYITDYQPHVAMEKVDSERGYGLGHVSIQNQTEAPNDAPAEQMEAAGIRTIRIPFIIKEKKLSPFDLLINDTGAIIPLTESRLRQALFRPQAFDVTSRTPGDQSMIGQLYPPYRQNMGFGGGGMSMNAAGGMGVSKVGSALEEYLNPSSAKRAPLLYVKTAAPRHTASLLSAILHTVDPADVSTLTEEVVKAGSALIARHKQASPRFVDAVNELLSQDGTDKTAGWDCYVRPDTIQVQKSQGGYLVKTSSHKFWDPKVAKSSRGDVVREYGAKVAMVADTTGCCTISRDLVKTAGEEEAAAVPLAPVVSAGVYRVVDSSGDTHTGFVTPGLIGVDGQPVSLSLFTDGKTVAVQEDIAGSPSDAPAGLVPGPIGGSGAFYLDSPEGVRMTVPMTLQDSVSMEGQPRTYNGISHDGQEFSVSVQPNLADITATPEKLLVPDFWKWLPLDGAEEVMLVAEDAANAQNVEAKMAQVEIISDGESFTLRGLPLSKLAQEHKSFLDIDGAMFLLAGLGVGMERGVAKLAEAAALGEPSYVTVSRLLSRGEDLLKVASAKLAGVSDAVGAFRQPILLKEAASFPDPQMVDTVLSLGFINPENLMTFVSYLPDIEDVQGKLCETLFAVRVGLSSVSQSALERAIRSTEEVIEGLKVLAFQGS